MQYLGAQHCTFLVRLVNKRGIIPNGSTLLPQKGLLPQFCLRLLERVRVEVRLLVSRDHALGVARRLRFKPLHYRIAAKYMLQTQ